MDTEEYILDTVRFILQHTDVLEKEVELTMAVLQHQPEPDVRDARAMALMFGVAFTHLLERDSKLRAILADYMENEK